MRKRAFVPAFLQKIDDKLLRNKPATWAVRTHLVVWFAALFAIALAACSYIAFYDARQSYNTGGWLAIVALIVFIGFVFWLIFLLRFNVFKRYGNWFYWDGLKQFLLYFIAIGSMAAICMIPSAIQTFRANQQFTSDEIVSDVNEINLAAYQLEYNTLPKFWQEDTCHIVDAPMEGYQERLAIDTMPSEMEYIDSYKYQYLDTAQFRRKIELSDSTVKLNDSIYIFYTCPNYMFVEPNYAIDYSSKKTLYPVDIYHALIGKQPKDKRVLLDLIQKMKIKYSARTRYDNYYDVNDNPNANYYDKIQKKYRLNPVRNGITYICSKKYDWVRNGAVYGRVFLYTTFILSLLVFVFRHTTVKTFFLTILAAAVIVILTGLLIALINGREKGLLSFALFYYVLFAIIAIDVANAKVRKAAHGIALNLFFIMTPFVPIIALALYSTIEDDYNAKTGYPSDYFDLEFYMPITEVAGTIVFLILLEPIFRKLYRHWYAAPES